MPSGVGGLPGPRPLAPTPTKKTPPKLEHLFYVGFERESGFDFDFDIDFEFQVNVEAELKFDLEFERELNGSRLS